MNTNVRPCKLKLTVSVLLAFALLTLQTATFASSSANPIKAEILKFRNHVGWTMQVTGDVVALDAAEALVASRIKTYIETNPDSNFLVEATPNGQTPLIEAATLGFAQIVEALLTSRRVVSKIDAVDTFDVSAWTAANMSFYQTLWSCSPSILTKNEFMAWVPRLQYAAYLASAPQNRFQSIRIKLVAAGAKQDIEQAKRVWLSMCTSSDRYVQEQIKNSDDVLLTLLHDSQLRFARFQIELQKTSDISNRPLPDKGILPARIKPPIKPISEAAEKDSKKETDKALNSDLKIP